MAVFSVSEHSLGPGVDLNGDGDTEDSVLHVLDLASGKIENLRLAGSPLETDGRWVALSFYEAGQGFDLNGDGDMTDSVLHLLDSSTMLVENRGLSLGSRWTLLAAGRMFLELDDGALHRYEIEDGTLHPVISRDVHLEDVRDDGDVLVYSYREGYRDAVWYYLVPEDRHVFLALIHVRATSIRGKRIAWHDDSGIPACGETLPWIHFHEIDAEETLSAGMIGDIWTLPAQGSRFLAINASEYANGEDLDGDGTIGRLTNVLQYFLFPCRGFDDLRETADAGGFDDLLFDPPIDQRIDDAESASKSGDPSTASRILSEMIEDLEYEDPGINGAVASVSQCIDDFSP